MTNKIFKLFCALSLCLCYSTPLSYARDDSQGFERPDEGTINSRAVAFNSSEAASILSDFKEKKAEQINTLRNNVNVYLPPVSNVEHSQLGQGMKNNLELKKLQSEVEDSLKNPISEDVHQNLPHEVIMDLPESMPKDSLMKNNKTDDVNEINTTRRQVVINVLDVQTQKIEGLISDAHEDGNSDSRANLHNSISHTPFYEKELSEAPAFSEAHFSSRNNSDSTSPYFGQITSSTNSLFVAESAPLILHLENQDLNTEKLDAFISETREKNIQPDSEEKANPTLKSEVQENENSFFLNPKIIPEQIVPETDEKTIQAYEIQQLPDFSEGVGAFLRLVSEEGFFFSNESDFESADESEDFSGLEEASAQCLENPANAACQDLFIAFISQPLLLKSTPSGQEEGIDLENFALISEGNDSLMMEAGLTPEETESASFALTSSGTDDLEANADQNSKKGSDSDKKSKSASVSTDTAQKRAIEVPLGMPDFYLPWQRAVLHDAKFVKVDATVFEKTEPESLSKIQARVAPENSLYNVMPKFSSEDTQKNSEKAVENNPLDMDYDFPLKSIFERPLPGTFPIKAIIQPQHNIQVTPISSNQILDVPMEWQIYEWFFEFCTDFYYYDWNWMLWLNQEESRFLRNLDS